MEESLKSRLILILAIVAAIFFMGTIRSCGTTKKLKLALIELDKEKALSWDAQQNTNELKKELAQTKAGYEVSNKELLKEQLASQALKEELEKVTKLKEKLEEDLKEALVSDKSGKPKK